MIRNNKLLIITIIFFILMILMPTIVKAVDPIEHPGYFKPNEITSDDTKVVTEKAGKILGTISTIGIVISVLTSMILGIKYMVGSVSEKAEYKKSMIPYIIGIVLLLSSSLIVALIANMSEGTFNTQTDLLL